MQPLLFDIFIEQLHAATIIPFASDATLVAMKSFGQEITLPVIVAFIASLIGQSFNWALGAGLYRLAQKKGHLTQTTSYAKTALAFNKYLLFTLIFSWFAIFNLFVLAAGFLGTRFKVALPIITLGQALYWGFFLFAV